MGTSAERRPSLLLVRNLRSMLGCSQRTGGPLRSGKATNLFQKKKQLSSNRPRTIGPPECKDDRRQKTPSLHRLGGGVTTGILTLFFGNLNPGSSRTGHKTLYHFALPVKIPLKPPINEEKAQSFAPLRGNSSAFKSLPIAFTPPFVLIQAFVLIQGFSPAIIRS